MSRNLRVLPIVGIAIGGLIAVKALAGVEAFPDLLAATSAAAEEAPGRRPPRKLNEAAAQTPLQSTAPAAPPKPAPICAPSLAELARETSLSPAELTTLQSLQARRGQLDDRERAIDTQRQLIAAAELKLDAKLRALTALRDEMKGVLSQADASKQAEVDRLVKVYEKMKPRDAGAIMATLDERVRLPVASKMREASLAAILSQMGTLEAKKLTEGLARRFAPPEKLAQAVATPPPVAAPQPAIDPLADATIDPVDAPPVKPKVAPKARPAKAGRKAVAKRAAGPARTAQAAPAEAALAKIEAPALPAGPIASAAPTAPAPASPNQVAAAGDTRAK